MFVAVFSQEGEARTQPGWDRTPVFTGSSNTKPSEAMLRNISQNMYGAVIAAGCVGQRLANVDLQVRGHGQHSGVEGDVVAGAGGQAVPRVQALGSRAVLPRLDVVGQQHLFGAERSRVQAAEDTPAAAVGQHIQRENVLPYAGRGQDDPFGISLWPLTLGGATGNLIPQGALEYRRAQLTLAEEGKLAAVLRVEEIGQAVAVDAFGRAARSSRR